MGAISIKPWNLMVVLSNPPEGSIHFDLFVLLQAWVVKDRSVGSTLVPRTGQFLISMKGQRVTFGTLVCFVFCLYLCPFLKSSWFLTGTSGGDIDQEEGPAARTVLVLILQMALGGF